MKTLFITLFLVASLVATEKQEEIKVIEAVFDSYEEGTYYFTGKDGTDYKDATTYEFSGIDAAASEKFDLTGLDFVGDTFKVSYRTEETADEEDEDGETEELNIIIDLQLVK